MTRRVTWLAAIAVAFVSACEEPEPPSAEGARINTDSTVVAEDPHAGHDMSAPAAVDSSAADVHAAHRGASAAQADHREHAPAVSGRAAAHADHADHAPEHAAQSTPGTGAMHGDSGHARLMELIRLLLSDPAAARRVQEDSVLRRLWSDSAVRNHVQSTRHSH